MINAGFVKDMIYLNIDVIKKNATDKYGRVRYIIRKRDG